MVSADDPDGAVWIRVYLALASLALIGVGLLASAGVSSGALAPAHWPVAQMLLGTVGLLAVVVGPAFARLVLAGIGVVLIVGALGLYSLLSTLPGGAAPAVVDLVAQVVAGAASIWLAFARPKRQWWLALLATGLPFLLGGGAAAAAFLSDSVGESGCDVADAGLLRVGATALAAQVPDLRPGELQGCDSGSAPSIEWTHPDLGRLLADARAAGCADGESGDPDEPATVMVCRAGGVELELVVTPDDTSPEAAGYLWAR